MLQAKNYNKLSQLPQKELAKKALNIENNTLDVFEKLNNVLKMNCKNI